MLLNRLWKATSGVLFGEHGVPGDPNNVRQRAQDAAPVVWLLGKTGAGKTAIISALTGDTRAEVGEGFAPCTPYSQKIKSVGGAGSYPIL